VFDAINQRRSVKAFDPSHRLSAAEETKLLEAAIQSPTSFNMQNWRFVIVRDPELRTQIRAAAADQAQVTDAALRSCGIAGQTIMLAAKAMGYDSCPMIGFDPVKVAEIINLPSDHVIGFMLAVGKAVKPAGPKGGQLDLAEVVVQDRFA
jgi:nitroreductase